MPGEPIPGLPESPGRHPRKLFHRPRRCGDPVTARTWQHPLIRVWQVAIMRTPWSTGTAESHGEISLPAVCGRRMPAAWAAAQIGRAAALGPAVQFHPGPGEFV